MQGKAGHGIGKRTIRKGKGHILAGVKIKMDLAQGQMAHIPRPQKLLT